MTEQEYIWLTLLPKNCQFCSKPYKQYLYDIWPSRIVACESYIENTKEEYNSLDKSQREEWIEERKEQVKRAKEVLNLYFQQDYQEVYKSGVFNPNRESILPHSNYVQDGSTSTILADAKDNPKNAKKSFVKPKLETNQVDDSSISYSFTDSSGFIGKYRFGEIMLSNLGYYRYKSNFTHNGTEIKNFWNGTWTGKNGCNSYNDFLNNKLNVQERAIREAFQFNLLRINHLLSSPSYNQSLSDYLDKSLKFSSGCNFQSDGLSVPNVTLAGILASAYLIDPEDVGKAFVEGVAPCDNRTLTSLTRYLLDFGGCDFSSENVNEAVSSFANVSLNSM
ncbi:11971_t:CDS:2 [Racocetra fulgida]|uniref:11971_t:CDS:1 n=1 Tax=Racocetra fulgida TaxID=60492 RepID=A0A9N8ZYU9_9GLOM|nr:11971_t:CDS:2 [Racocetra fulgida]